MWNPDDQTGQVSARMETTPSLGSASISVSQQQSPKKFAPVVAPKPKFNPYKPGETGNRLMAIFIECQMKCSGRQEYKLVFPLTSNRRMEQAASTGFSVLVHGLYWL